MPSIRVQGYRAERSRLVMEGIVHGTEATLFAHAETLPYALLCCNEIGKSLTDAGEAGQGCNVSNSGKQENFGQELGWEMGDRAGLSCNAFDIGLSCFD